MCRPVIGPNKAYRETKPIPPDAAGVRHIAIAKADSPLSDSSPAMIRSRVVLPEPDGPSSAANSPSRMVSETSFSAG